MNMPSILVECAREVYEREKGVSFAEDSTHIVWHNPDFDSWQDDIGIDPLQLARPDDDPFKIIKARLYAGCDQIETGIKVSDAPSDRAAAQFADRFMNLYRSHDHEACIAAAANMILKQQVVIVRMRKPVSGEITLI